MEIDAALKAAREVLKTGERAEIVPTADGAEVYVLKRRKVKPNTEPRPKRWAGGAERG